MQRYGRTPEPVTPYQRAGQVWDERIGSARVQARNWRLIAFGGLALSTAMSGGLLWQSMQSRVVPYIVEVDALGEARAVARSRHLVEREVRCKRLHCEVRHRFEHRHFDAAAAIGARAFEQGAEHAIRCINTCDRIGKRRT